MSDEVMIPSDILDDLSSRFIVNVPEEERREPTRLCFQIELAYWFYLDFLCPGDATLKNCGMKEFTAQIFEHIPYLTPWLKNLDQVIDNWKTYKLSVPTYGAIVLNEDLTKVLLVQSFFSKASWGFPKGKVNECETPANCAVREVLEETGLDISKKMNETDFIEATVNDQPVRLYIIHGVKDTVKLEPKTRNEIRSVEWFPVADLPCGKKDTSLKLRQPGLGARSFFMIFPFIKRIKNWIRDRTENGQRPHNQRRHRHKSAGELPISYSPSSPHTIQWSKNRANQYKITQDDSEPVSLLCNSFSSSGSTKDMGQPSKTFKRQLFYEDDTANKFLSLDPKMTEVQYIIVPRWLSFKLDRAAILKCFDD